MTRKKKTKTITWERFLENELEKAHQNPTLLRKAMAAFALFFSASLMVLYF